MENDKFRQLCGKVSYNTYTNIQNGCLASSMGISLASELLSQYPILNNSAAIFTSVLGAT